MNSERLQNILLGVVIAGLILLGAGMYMFSLQLRSVATTVNQIKQGIAVSAPTTDSIGDTDKGILVVDDGQILMTTDLLTKIGTVSFSLNCYGQVVRVTPRPIGDSDAAGDQCVGEQALFAVFPGGSSKMIDSAFAADGLKMSLIGAVKVSPSDPNLVLVQYAPDACNWNPDVCPTPVVYTHSLNLTTKAVEKLPVQ